MPYAPFHILHIFSVLVLVGVTFMAFSAPPELRRKILMWSGIASLIVFLTGFGLLGVLKVGVPGWALVKLAAWLVLSALAGLAFRFRSRSKHLLCATMVAALVAVAMVSLKPF